MDRHFPLAEFLASSLHDILKTVVTVNNLYGLSLKKLLFFQPVVTFLIFAWIQNKTKNFWQYDEPYLY